MWGKLNQMVSGDQQKIQNLEEALEMEQQRNKIAQDQFRKLLKEKEKQIQKFQSQSGSSGGASEKTSNGATDVRFFFLHLDLFHFSFFYSKYLNNHLFNCSSS